MSPQYKINKRSINFFYKYARRIILKNYSNMYLILTEHKFKNLPLIIKILQINDNYYSITSSIPWPCQHLARNDQSQSASPPVTVLSSLSNASFVFVLKKYKLSPNPIFSNSKPRKAIVHSIEGFISFPIIYTRT